MKTFNRHDYAIQLRKQALGFTVWINILMEETECEREGRQVTWLW